MDRHTTRVTDDELGFIGLKRNTSRGPTMQLRQLHLGIEIDTIRRTREDVARAIQSATGGSVRDHGGAYDSWEVTDAQGRIWKIVSDALSDAFS
jgi:hypothetical protein